MKKHHAKIARVYVIDFLTVIQDVERYAQGEPLLDRWERKEGDPKAIAKQKKEKHKQYEKELNELLDLRDRSLVKPIHIGQATDVPLTLFPRHMSYGNPLDNRPAYSYILFHDYIYQVMGPYTENEFCLLVLDEFDRERRMFEKLHSIHVDSMENLPSAQRERIPEKTRILVWRRDGGKCAQCGSRERLEYDHIVPISKGGSNTVRNIELLCEACNRRKSDRIQ